MRTRLVSLLSFTAALGLAVGAAQAADKFECPAAAGQDRPTIAPDLLKTVPTGEALGKLETLQNAVELLRTNGVRSATTVNYLMASYCPWIAANTKLSDADKTSEMRRFATRVTGIVYSRQDAEEILFSVPLSPREAADLEARARAANTTPSNWIARTLRPALKTP
jgi:hypothetical protein